MSVSPNSIDGTWQMVRAELDGVAAPEFVAAKTEIRLTAGAYEVRFDCQRVDCGSYALDATSEPKTIILRGESGPNAGRTIPCVYQIAGDRLRVCYGLGGIAPGEFATAVGQQRYLATYRRKFE